MTGAGNWTWLIEGRVPTLIDAGVGDPKHLAAIGEALHGAVLSQVLVTHIHSDHASGAPAIASRTPGTRFRKFPWPERDARFDVEWEPIDDGAKVDAGDTAIVAVHTPGHSPDHLCFWHEESRTVFCGDLAQRGSTVWIPAKLQGDMGAYITSLERILALDPARMLPAHGPIVDDPVPLLRYYIDHRLEREAQVLDALRRGDETVPSIVARIYQGLQEIFIPLAEESVTAHLLKLEREGRARSSDGAWHMIEP
jgi:glyoxylase-like metal-dependent hydrolase (beta-lactamase superfamily II)